MDPDDADDGRDEPADSRQERKGHDSFPIAALVASDDMKIIPVENGAARSTKVLAHFISYTDLVPGNRMG